MSESEATPTIRRSTRERKAAKPFTQVSTTASKKRKRDTDDEAGDATDKLTTDGGELEEGPNEDPDDEDEDEEDYFAPKTKTTNVKRQPAGAAGASKNKTKSPIIKKPRTVKPKTGAGARKTKADASVDVLQQIKDSHISDDNALFNTILNPSAALQSTVEDYLESLSNTPDLALADLINCILRACGCNDSVDSDEATDHDGVVDKLDTFTEGLKQGNAPLYPLVSKLPIFKKFRKQLSEFLHRLVASSAELGSLYTSDLLPTILPWVVAMSSSQLRSLRHTATVVAMDLESALCEVAAEVEKEVVIIARQREGEKKRASTAKSKSKGKGRDKEFENKAEEVRERKTTLKTFIDDFFNGVFVHRYRDHDPGIRTECVQAMGVWFKRHPSQFLDGRYFHYVGWVLSDADIHVRLAAVKSLQALYASPEHLGTLQQFTDRFKGRLVQMATSDLELSVRVAALQVLAAIDSHSLLEEEQRDELCLLVYDEEPRVRKAVAGFVKGVWDEAIEDRMLGRNNTGDEKEKETERVGIKCLATLLVKWGKRTRPGSLQSSGNVNDEESPVEESESKNRDIVRLVSAKQKGRIALAMDALWEDAPAIADWEALLEHLLLDHSASDVGTSPMRSGKKSKVVEVEVVDEAWRLSEPEEAALLECFVAVLRRIKEEAGPGLGGKKGEAETVVSDMTRALIKGLPRLFAKHQTDPNRVADVLMIPQLMNLDMYLEMRMIPAYENLWDDIIKQFTSHSSPITLSHATAAIQHLTSSTLLTNTNTSKNTELEEELSTSLRDAVAGREELDVAGFSEDEVHTLGAIAARLVVLSSVRDLTGWMEEDEGGKQSSAWDIMNALAGRGRLGYKEEEVMIEECLRLLTLHLAWKSRDLGSDAEPSEEAVKYKELLEEQRSSVLEKVTEFAVGSDSKPCEGVKRAAFHNLINLHILFCHGEDTPASALPLSMDDETQYRCAGFVQAEVEQFVDELVENEERENGRTTEEETSRAGSTSEGEDDTDADAAKKVDAGKKQRKGRPRKEDRDDSPDPRSMPQSRLEREYVLNALLATFIRAIRVGVLNPSHSAVVLAHYNRLGTGFDINIKVVIDFLRDMGMFKGEGQVVTEIIVRAIQESFKMFMDDVVRVDDHAVALARALSACFIIRGAQLSVVKRLESEHVVDVQTRSISWIIKLLAGYETSSNKKMAKKALLFFRVLQQLVASVESRDALKIKAHLDQAIAQSKVQIGTAKAWDSYRAYEKRLAAAMSKDKTIPVTKGKKRMKKGAKSGEMVRSDDDEAEVEELIAESGTDAEADAAVPPPRPKPKAKPRPKARRQRPSEGNDGDDEHVRPVARSAIQLRSPSKRRAAQKSAIRDDVAMTDVDEPVQEQGQEPVTNGDSVPGQNGTQPITNGHQSIASTPALRKRRREPSEPVELDDQENVDPATDQAPSPARSHISVADVKNRHKRVRR